MLEATLIIIKAKKKLIKNNQIVKLIYLIKLLGLSCSFIYFTNQQNLLRIRKYVAYKIRTEFVKNFNHAHFQITVYFVITSILKTHLNLECVKFSDFG